MRFFVTFCFTFSCYSLSAFYLGTLEKFEFCAEILNSWFSSVGLYFYPMLIQSYCCVYAVYSMECERWNTSQLNKDSWCIVLCTISLFLNCTKKHNLHANSIKFEFSQFYLQVSLYLNFPWSLAFLMKIMEKKLHYCLVHVYIIRIIRIRNYFDFVFRLPLHNRIRGVTPTRQICVTLFSSILCFFLVHWRDSYCICWMSETISQSSTLYSTISNVKKLQLP